MSKPSGLRTSFSIGRRWMIALNVVIAGIAVLALAVMANYLSSRHFQRVHWANERFQLSPLTLRLLESLTNTVKVIVFFDADPGNPVYSDVKGLINEYELVCPKLEVQYVDYFTQPGPAKVIKSTYALSPNTDKDLVVFDANGVWKIVYANELSDYDLSGMFAGQEIKRKAFKGERAFTSAILNVTESRQFKAHYLIGHGEHDPTAEDSQAGYLEFVRVLQEKKVSVQPLSLQTNEVPADCQLLVIAGPRYSLSAHELEEVDEYLNRGGRALVLFNALETRTKIGLEQLLSKWGVVVGDDNVLDLSETKAGQNLALYVNRFGRHDIVAPLAGARLTLIAPHSVRGRAGAQSAETAKVVELGFTSEHGIARSRQGREESSGVIPVMAAVDKGTIQGVSADRGSTRLVVVGDSGFLANGPIDFDANRDFANLAINWLLDRTQFMAIGPRPIREYRLSLSQSQMRKARWTLLGAMPGSVLLLGLLVWFRRR
jgi:ABC-type uncharacterized transport system involved in gliding motility auxiliary subunit